MKYMQCLSHITTLLIFAFIGTGVAHSEVLVTVTKHDKSQLTPYGEYCETIYKGLNASINTDLTCIETPPQMMVDPRIEQAKKTYRFKYHFNLQEDANELVVTIKNWSQEDNTDFNVASYKIPLKDSAKSMSDLFTLTKNFQDFDNNKHRYKKFLLRNLLSDSKMIAIEANGEFIDKLSGRAISPKIAYSIYSTESARTRHNLRIGMEIATAFAFSTYWYYQDPGNEFDWDYTLVDGIQKKLNGKAILYDDNGKYINIGHAGAGMIWHGIARINGHSAGESFLVNAFTSALWESVIEYQELFSINDTIFTSIGGSVIGESIYQVVAAWNDNNSCSGSAALGRLSSYLSKLRGKEVETNFLPACDSSLAPARQLDLSASLGYMTTNNNVTIPLAIRAEVLNVPVAPNKNIQVLIPDVFYSKIEAQADDITNPVGAYRFLTQVAYAAIYKQNLKSDSNGNLKGYQFIISPSTRFDILDRSYDHQDFIASVNMIGPRAQVIGHINGYRINFVLEIYKDFAMVSSYALDKYKAQNSLAGLLSTIQEYSYYYGYGNTRRAELSVSNSKIQIGADYQQSYYEAVTEGTRHQEEVTQNISLSDRSSRERIFLEFTPKKKISFEISVERIRRSGEINSGQYADHATEKRVYGQIKYKFD